MSSLIFISWWTQSLSSNYPFSPYTVGVSTFFSEQNTSRWPYFPQHKQIARSPLYSKGSSLPLAMILGTKSLSRSNSTKKICELSPRVNRSHLIDLQHSAKSVPNPTQKLCYIIPWLSATSWSMLQPFFWYQDSNRTQFSTFELSVNGPLSSKDPKKCMFIVINMFNWIIKKSFGRLMILILPFTTHSRFRRFSVILKLTFFLITLTKNTHFHGIHYLTNSSTMTWIFENFPLSSSVIIDPTTLAPFARSLNHLASSSTPKQLKPLFFTLWGQ